MGNLRMYLQLISPSETNHNYTKIYRSNWNVIHIQLLVRNASDLLENTEEMFLR